MNRILLALLVTTGIFLKTVISSGLSFDGFRQYRLSPMSDRALERLRWLEKQFPSEPDPQAGLVFLTRPGQKFERVDVLVPPNLQSMFLSLIESTPAVRMRLIHRDYGRLLAKFNLENAKLKMRSVDQLSRQRRQASAEGADGRMQLKHDFYRSFSEIRLALLLLSDRCNQIRRKTCALDTIGLTLEGKELLVLKIAKSTQNSTTSRQRTAVWLDAGIHAREWVSPATALYIADLLINIGLPASLDNSRQHSAAAADAAEMVENHEIFILTLYNPDGYEYSRLRNRMWRKNRQRSSLRRLCRGVDLNRNYGYRWGGAAGSSSNPCADNFRGQEAFSALETAAVKQFIEVRASKLLAFLSLHSYGQYFLIPYGYSKNTYSKTHHKKMMCAASLAIHKMFPINDRFYSVGTGSDLLYEATGGSDDWAHGHLGIPYSYTIELPDEGDYGFLLPARKVPGIGREIMRGLASLLGAARRMESSSVQTAEAEAECSRLIDGAFLGDSI